MPSLKKVLEKLPFPIKLYTLFRCTNDERTIIVRCSYGSLLKSRELFDCGKGILRMSHNYLAIRHTVAESWNFFRPDAARLVCLLYYHPTADLCLLWWLRLTSVRKSYNTKMYLLCEQGFFDKHRIVPVHINLEIAIFDYLCFPKS